MTRRAVLLKAPHWAHVSVLARDGVEELAASRLAS